MGWPDVGTENAMGLVASLPSRPPKGDDAVTRTRAAAEDQRNKPSRAEAFGVHANPPDMPALTDGHQGQTSLFGQADAVVNGKLRGHLPEAPQRVDIELPICCFPGLGDGSRVDLSFQHLVDVLRKADQTMGG